MAAAQKKGRSVAGPPFLNAKRTRSGHRAGDVAQHTVDLGADGTHGSDGRNGNQRGDQRVLDGSRAVLAFHQTTENGQHLYLQRKRLSRLSSAIPTVLGTAGGIDTKAGVGNAPLPQ